MKLSVRLNNWFIRRGFKKQLKSLEADLQAEKKAKNRETFINIIKDLIAECHREILEHSSKRQ